jgi:Cu(I)/Ag(I) efflux system membrane fusion protein
LLIILALGAGFAVGVWRSPGPAEPEAVEDRAPAIKEPLYWVAPMDPNYRRDKPGKSPMGMDLIPVYEEPGASEGAITIDAAMENSLGVRTEPARVRPLWRRVEATAYVGYDETLISHISVRTQGWITRLLFNADGERVRKDDLLFELYSPELVNAQKEYLQARKRNDSRLISGGEEKLRALGMIRSEVEALARTGNMSESVRVVAPQDGVISALNVREGMFVEPNSTIMSLADLSSVWLQAEVFESQAEWVAAGQAAKASLDYLPGHEFNGQVDYVYPILDPKTRTLRVRLRFENPEERLKPNMYARVSIYGKLHPNALSIPREALIRGKGMSRVVLSLGDGRFRVHEVLTGMESGDSIEIIAGIEEGAEVVTSAQFLLDSEASLAGGIKRLEAVPAQEERERFELVLASGRVEAVDPVRRRIRVSHGPIDALAWPGMIMEFEVLPEVGLNALRVGQNVRFALQQQHAGEYAIARLSTEEDESELTVQTPADEQADTRAGAREAEAVETGAEHGAHDHD